jgi:hypothetical protein
MGKHKTRTQRRGNAEVRDGNEQNNVEEKEGEGFVVNG